MAGASLWMSLDFQWMWVDVLHMDLHFSKEFCLQWIAPALFDKNMAGGARARVGAQSGLGPGPGWGPYGPIGPLWAHKGPYGPIRARFCLKN